MNRHSGVSAERRNSWMHQLAALYRDAATGRQFMGSLLSLLRTHWDDEPLRLTEARCGPRVCDPQPARLTGREHLQRLDVSWGHEPLRFREARSGPRVCDPQPARFTGREHLQRLDVSWGHEPLRLREARSGPRVCDPQPARFMESFHGLAPTRLGSAAFPGCGSAGFQPCAAFPSWFPLRPRALYFGSIFSMTPITPFTFSGLAMYMRPPILPSGAPSSSFLTAAVKKTTGVFLRAGSCFRPAATSPPSMSGSITSSRTKSGLNSRAASTARAPKFSSRTS